MFQVTVLLTVKPHRHLLGDESFTRLRPPASSADEDSPREASLFLILLLTTSPRRGRRLPLALHATRAATAEGRVQREVNVLLRIGAHEERGHVHDLLADADVAL